MWQSAKEYDRLPVNPPLNSDNIIDWDTQPSNQGLVTLKIVAICTLAALLSGSIGFVVGFYCANIQVGDIDSLLAPDGTVKHTMVYNRTFSRAPSNETNAAWQSIFPSGRGFIQHPVFSPNISGIAVFHELHCLDALRVGYYEALNNQTANNSSAHHHGHRASPSPTSIKSPGGHSHDDPGHMRHCFDYLRQSLMCAADTNLEPVDWKLRGITGWGNERTCRDYNGVVKWAERWRTHNQTSHT